MAWEEELFAVLDDLEQQAGAAYAAERDLELADRARAEYREVTLAGRLMASLEREVDVAVLGVGALSGELRRVGDGWLLLRGRDQEWIVALAALGAVHGASDRAVPEVAWSPLTRLGLGSALRRLAEAGRRCVLHLRDGAVLDGVPTRVGADFVEVAVGEPGSGRTALVPQAALAAVQSRD